MSILDKGSDGLCTTPPIGEEISDLIVGLTTGCNEYSGPASLLWGTNEDYKNLVQGNPVARNNVLDENGNDINDALKIISVVAIKPETGDPDDWQILYLDSARQPKVGFYPYSPDDLVNGKGAFLHADNGEVCISNDAVSAITTREVVLKKSEMGGSVSVRRLHEYFPITNPDQFTTQEQLNEVFTDVDLELHQLKPTIIVAPYTYVTSGDEARPDYDDLVNENEVYENYIPIKGDLWLDPTDNVLRGCKSVTYSGIDHSMGFSDAEWVVVSGDSDNTTRDVILYNTLKFYNFLDDSGIYSGSFDDFEEVFGLTRQEDANLLNLDLLDQLNKNKPTVHVTENIFTVREEFAHTVKNPAYDPTADFHPVNNPEFIEEIIEHDYIPRKGDIWVDKNDLYDVYC